MNKTTLIASAVMSVIMSHTVLANQEMEQLQKVTLKQEKALQSLERRLNKTEQRLEATAEYIDSTTSATSATSVGGYGELHYNNIDDKKMLDFHRFVLFVNHNFTDKLRFSSELEVEHVIAADSEKGEVELEQAFIEYDYSHTITAKAGLFLVPVGIINETHEPPAFYGVERNPVEKNIIPATWWEGGVGFNYQPMGGVSFDFALTSGLNVGHDYKIRSGRQKVSKANAESLAFTSRVEYTATNGLELAATVQYQQDLTQGLAGVDKADATLIALHGIYQIEQFSITALYARWDINGNEAKALGRDIQRGWYIEPAYKINEKVALFARYAEYDNSAGNNDESKNDQFNMGINYYLHENVVLKADWQRQDSADKNGFNLGVGYQF